MPPKRDPGQTDIERIFKSIPLKTIHIKRDGPRWRPCNTEQAQYSFQLSNSVYHTERYLMYGLIIENQKRRLILRQVGNFSREELALLALNKGTISCKFFKSYQQRNPDLPVICPKHLNDTCAIKLGKNICPIDELKAKIEREYFLVHKGTLVFSDRAWWL